MNKGNYNFEKIYTGNQRTNRFFVVAVVFTLIAFFGTAKSVFSQTQVPVKVDEIKRIKKFSVRIDPRSLVVDYNPRTNEIDKIPSVAEVFLSEDGTELLVKGLKEGTADIKLGVKGVNLPVMGNPNESPFEQGNLSVGLIRVSVSPAEAKIRPDKNYVVNAGKTTPVSLSSLLGANFGVLKKEGTDWQNIVVKITARGRMIATAEANTKTMNLEITGGEKPGERMEIILEGEELTESKTSWRKVICKVKVLVSGQKPKPPTTPDGIRKKLDEDIKPQMDKLDDLTPAEKNELLDDLTAMENSLKSLIKREEERELIGVTEIEKRKEIQEKEENLKRLRDLLDEIGQIKQLVEESLSDEGKKAAGRAKIFERLKQRYLNELKPAAANAGNLTDEQKSALQREWKPIPDYLDQLIGEENNSAEPREQLSNEMEKLKEAIRADLAKLQVKKKIPLVLIFYGDTRAQDAAKAAETLQDNGYTVQLKRSGIHFPGLYQKLLYSRDGTMDEARKIADLVQAVEGVTLEAGTPPQGEQWVYLLNLFDPKKFP